MTLACAAADFPEAAGRADTAAFEITLLERAFGALMPVLLRMVGIPGLRGRTDLDALAASLTSLGL